MNQLNTFKPKKMNLLNFLLMMTNVFNLEKMALLIEKHYKKPMDIEWGIDGVSGRKFSFFKLDLKQ